MDGDECPPLKPPDAAAPPSGGGGGEQQQDQDGSRPAPSLPDDVLANIFGRLAPRCVAASRRVCPSWRASIDARRLLRADLLPLSLRGVFLHFDVHKFPAFFSRPGPDPPGAPALTGNLSFLPFASPFDCAWRIGEGYKIREKFAIKNHCNGLLLVNNYVVNPATRRWDALPPAPPARVQFLMSTDDDPHQTPIPETINSYLVFDPTVSPHYQVIRICSLSRMGSIEDLSEDDSECPASSCTLNVLSSKTGCWEERRFVREGAAAGTVAEVENKPRSGAVYWRGALYMHCESQFVLRISLSSNTYRVIKPPPRYGAYSPYLQKSEKGVYFVQLHNYLLRVWILRESCDGQLEWVLKHDRDLEPVLARHRPRQVHGPWVLKGVNHNLFCTHYFPEDNKEDVAEGKFEWCSDSDDVIEYQDMLLECSSEECYSDNADVIEGCSSEASKKASLEENFESSSNDDVVEECYSDEEDVCEIGMLGLHPFKEVIFLSESAKTGLAYHLNSSKIEALGDIYPTNYHSFGGYGLDMVKYAFMYTPCWIEEFPRNI